MALCICKQTAFWFWHIRFIGSEATANKKAEKE